MKKLIAAFLALCLACSMAACAGGTTSESSTTSTSSTSSESSVAEESVASEEPSSSDVSEASSEGSDTAEATVLSHEEYMAAELDTEVTIQAYVQAKQSYYAEQGTATVYLQDQDGAYFAYDMACTQEEYDAMTEGTCIQVTGFKSEWSGEIEIMDGQLDQIVEGDTFVAEPLDATELLGTDELEQHQNEKVSFTGLTVEYAAKRGACAILRGLRAVSDFEYEFQLALMNRRLQRDIQTVFLMTDYQWLFISSTIVKAAASHGADIVGLVPENVCLRLMEKYQRGEVRQATPCLSAPYGGFRVNK